MVKQISLCWCTQTEFSCFGSSLPPEGKQTTESVIALESCLNHKFYFIPNKSRPEPRVVLGFLVVICLAEINPQTLQEGRSKAGMHKLHAPAHDKSRCWEEQSNYAIFLASRLLFFTRRERNEAAGRSVWYLCVPN